MAATTPLVPACASCIFGAVSTSVLSYTAHVIKTIEVDVTPHVFIYLNGTRETTSLESNTHTEAIAIPTSNAAGTLEISQTFSDIRNVTWTVGDATLTYPTSYVQYLAFAGAPAIDTDEPACAEQTDATNVQLPSTTDAAEFIFPLGNASSATGLPGELLEYLDGLPTVSDQFNGAPITACAPLLHSTYTPSPVYSTLQAKPAERTDLDASSASIETLLPKRYEGPRGKQHQGPIVTLSPDAKNDTQGIGRRQDLSGSGFAIGTGTESFAIPSAPQESASIETRTTWAYSSVEATNVHTTAFVIAPITGRDIVTSESPSHGPTTHGGNTDTGTALPANNGGDESKPNENGENGSSSGNGDSSTDGDANGGASGGNDGSDSSGQTGGSGSDSSSQDSGNSHNGSNDGNNNEESGDSSADHSESDSSGSSDHSDNDAAGHSGDEDTTTGNESGDGTGEQSGSNDASNSSESGDAQGQSHGDSSSHHDSGEGASVISQAGGDDSQDQSDGADGSSAGNGDASQTSDSDSGDSAGAEADIANLLGGIASAASDIDQAGDVANTAQVQAAQATFAANGNTYTAVKQEDAVVAEGASATITIPGGSGTVFGGQTISAASDGRFIAVNGQQQTLTVPGASPSYDQTTLTEAGRTFTASQAEGTAIVLNEGGSSITVQGAEQTRFAGETVSVQKNGNEFVLSSQTISFKAAASASASAVFTAGIHTITALQADDAVILKDSTSTISVSDGAKTTFEGQAVSAASNGQSVIFGSQTIILDSRVTPAPDGQAVFTVDDYTVTAKQSGGSVILQDQSSAITVQDGATTRFENEDFSVASDGSSIIIDGTSTVLLTETTSASSTGIGGYINSGLSPGASATDGTRSSPSSTSTPTSGSGILRAGRSFMLVVLSLCGVALM
ncbi:hypothetical protein NU219Hw_g934t1 [Hortaea werneckii]